MAAFSTSGHPALRRTRTGCPLDAKRCKWRVVGVRCTAPIGTNGTWRAIWFRWLELGRGRSAGRHFGEVAARPAPQIEGAFGPGRQSNVLVLLQVELGDVLSSRRGELMFARKREKNSWGVFCVLGVFAFLGVFSCFGGCFRAVRLFICFARTSRNLYSVTQVKRPRHALLRGQAGNPRGLFVSKTRRQCAKWACLAPGKHRNDF